MNLIRQLCVGILSVVLTPLAHAGQFDIGLAMTGFSTSQQQVLLDAEAFWESTLVGVQRAQDVTLSISAKATAIDGVGKVLGSAGGQTRRADRRSAQSVGALYNSFGHMEFDTADLAHLENAGTLADVMLHEIAHVIGFGDAEIWNFWGVYQPGSFAYTGTHALAAFRVEFAPTATFVPVENNGGPGTAGAHWEETSSAIPSSDLMTGYLNGPTSISQTTLQSFSDIGFVVVSAVPLPGSLAMFIGALGILAALHTRHHR